MYIFRIFIIFTLLIILFFTTDKLFLLNKNKNTPSDTLYFPNQDSTGYLSFQFKNVLANILWFQTVNYFGKHFQGDKNYRWLNHMCNAVVYLDPKHKDIYEFCSLLIAWEANDPKEAKKILTKGIDHNEYWRFYYLRGMNSLIFFEDSLSAKNDFIKASKIPKSPPFLKFLAAKTMADLESPESVIEFLQNMISSAKDTSQKEALTERLLKTINEYNQLKLNEYLIIFRGEFKREPSDISELKTVGAPNSIFIDPYNGKYFIEDKKIKASNGVAINNIFKTKKELKNNE